MSPTLKKLVIGLLIVMLVSFAVAGLVYNLRGPGEVIPREIQDIDLTRSFDASGLEEITIRTVSADVNVIPVDEPEVGAHLYGNAVNTAPELVTEMNGGRLSVYVKHPPQTSVGVFNFQDADLKLDIFVPKNYDRTLTVRTTSGDLEVNELAPAALNYRTVSGSLQAYALRTETTVLSTTSGDVEVSDFTGNLEFRSVSGDLDVDYAEFAHDINVSTTSGDAKIELPKDAQFTVDYSSTSGNFSTGFPLTTQGLQEKRQISGVVGDGGHEINMRSVSGDLGIH